MSNMYLEIGLDVDPIMNSINPSFVEMEQLIPDNHEYLLEFLDYDLSKIEQLLVKYLSCLQTVEKKPNRAFLRAAVNELRKMHPYFILCWTNATLLLNRIIAGYIKTKFPDLSLYEQKKIFQQVCLPDYQIYTDIDEIFEISLHAGNPYILDTLFTIQKNIRTWVLLTIDNTNPQLALMNSQQRSALYAHVSGTDGIDSPALIIHASFSTKLSDALRKRIAKWEFSEIPDDADTEKVEQSPNSLKEEDNHYETINQAVDALYYDPESSLPRALSKVINLARDSSDCNNITYHLRDFENLLELEVYRMVTADARIKRCKCCKKYFLLGKKNQEYCNRLAPGSDKLCSEVGHSRSYGRKLIEEKNNAQALYRNAYKTRKARVSRGSMSKDDFNQWNAEAKGKRAQVESGDLDLYLYEEWLKL